MTLFFIYVVIEWMKEHENQMKTNEAKLKNEVETYLKKYDDKQELVNAIYFNTLIIFLFC